MDACWSFTIVLRRRCSGRTRTFRLVTAVFHLVPSEYEIDSVAVRIQIYGRLNTVTHTDRGAIGRTTVDKSTLLSLEGVI